MCALRRDSDGAGWIAPGPNGAFGCPLGANRGEYGEAEKAYGKTFEVDPGFALAHVELYLMALSTSAGAEQAAAHLRAALAYADRLPQKFRPHCRNHVAPAAQGSLAQRPPFARYSPLKPHLSLPH
jgi:tetratricopeptide (TPR) repeat protein